MKLAVLAARISCGRQIGEQGVVKEPARELGRQRLGIDATQDGPETEIDETSGQSTAVVPPDWKDALESVAEEPLFAVPTHVLQKDVAANDAFDTERPMPSQCGAHPLFIIIVGTARRNAHDLQRPTKRRRLLFEKRGANAVHADAVVAVGHGRQQSHDFAAVGDLEQGEGAVLSAAPGDDNFLQ